MKQLILLLLIVSATVISWSSCAKNQEINSTTIDGLSYSVASSSLLTPILTTPETEESLIFPQAKVVSEHNRFFEMSIVFNENLQQIIAFFTRSDNDKSYAVNNSFPSETSDQPIDNACKEG